AGSQVELGRMGSPLQIGFFTARMAEAIDLGGAERQLEALLSRLADLGLSPAELAEVGQLLRGGAADLRGAVREFVAEEARRQGAPARAAHPARQLASRPLSALTVQEVVELRGE